MPGNPGYIGPKEVKYLFVDGGCLRQMVEDASSLCPDFNIGCLDFSKLAAGHNKTFYYDCLPARSKNQDDSEHSARTTAQEAFFDSLRAIPGVHVYEGDARRRKNIIQQKKVDVMIAVDMLTHSFRRNMHRAALLTADLDFKPLIDALVQDGMHTTLLYPRGKPNRELIDAADERRPLTFGSLYGWSTADFQKSHPIPRGECKPGKSIEGGLLRESWPTAMGTTAELFEMESDGSFTLVFPSAANRDRDYYTYLNYPDRELLKLYVRECFREFWDSPI